MAVLAGGGVVGHGDAAVPNCYDWSRNNCRTVVVVGVAGAADSVPFALRNRTRTIFCCHSSRICPPRRTSARASPQKEKEYSVGSCQHPIRVATLT